MGVIESKTQKHPTINEVQLFLWSKSVFLFSLSILLLFDNRFIKTILSQQYFNASIASKLFYFFGSVAL